MSKKSKQGLQDNKELALEDRRAMAWAYLYMRLWGCLKNDWGKKLRNLKSYQRWK